MEAKEIEDRLRGMKKRCERLVVSGHREPEEWRRDAEALEIAINAVRADKKWVERMRGKWIFVQADWTKQIHGKVLCSRCKKCVKAGGYEAIQEAEKSYRFCPACGAVMADGAVDVMLRRAKESE